MDMLRKLYRIFDKKAKLGILVLFVAIMFNGILEVVALSLIQPFITILLDDSIVYTIPILNWVYEFLSLSSVYIFLALIAFGIAFVYIVRGVYTYVLIIIRARFIVRRQAKMSVYMLDRVMDFSYLWHTKHNIAQLRRIVVNDVGATYSIVQKILLFLQDAIMSLFILVFLFIVSPAVTLSVLLLSLFCAVIYFKAFKNKIKKLGARIRDSSIAASKAYLQAFGGIKEIKATNRKDYFCDTYRKHRLGMVKYEVKLTKINAVPQILTDSLLYVGGVILIGIFILAGTDITALVPQLSMFVIAAFRLIPAINRLQGYLSSLMAEHVSLNHIYKILFEEKDVAAQIDSKLALDENSPKDGIVVSNLTFKYPGIEESVLTNVSLHIPGNKSVAFVGPSGAGKTTLADIILGVLSPDAGGVFYEGKQVHTDLEKWSEMVGYIPQLIYLTDESILENVAFGIERKQIDEAKAWQALERAQLREFVETLPDGIHTIVGDRGVRLSGGQRQRVGIARALYNNPPILMLDEATSSLDNETESAIIESIKEFHGNKTVIIIAHRLSTIEHCDTVYRVEDNTVLQER